MTAGALPPCLAITPLVVPALVGFGGGRAACAAGWRRALARRAARRRRAGPPRRAPRARRLLGHGGGRCSADAASGAQQAYLLRPLARSGSARASRVIALLAASVAADLRARSGYRWRRSQRIGGWHVDTLARALAARARSGRSARAARRPLRGRSAARRAARVADRPGCCDAAPATGGSRPLRVARYRARMRGAGRVRVHAAAARRRRAARSLIWALTTRGLLLARAGSLLPLALALAIHALGRALGERPGVGRRQLPDAGARDPRRRLRGRCRAVPHRRLGGRAAAATSGRSGRCSRSLVVVGIARRGRARLGPARGPRWPSGSTTLETTRAGAVDAQEAELRRIERDLHDGAQARLVALGMSLGMAEQKLAADPERRARAARRGAASAPSEALEELRDLARGIHPPVLADRGLEAAIAALASSTPLHGRRLASTLRATPPPPVETAAYFVVAEALANAGKHAQRRRTSTIADRRARDASSCVEVTDDGARRRRPGRRRAARAAPAGRGARRHARRHAARPAGRRRSGRRCHAGRDRRGPRAAARRARRACCATTASRSSPRSRDGDALVHAVLRERPGHRDRRHPPAADVPRRGPARRARAARARARDGGPDRLAVRRADLRRRAARRRPRRRRLPAQGPDHGRRRLRRRRPARRRRRHRARPRGRRAAVRAPPARTARSSGLTPARARGARR